MDIKQQFDELLHRPVTRKEFLIQFGVLLMGVFGFSRILELLFKHRDSNSGGKSGQNGLYGG